MSHIIRIFHFSKIFFSDFLKRYPSTFSLLLWGHIHINRILSSYSSEFRSQKFKKFSKKKLIFESEHSSLIKFWICYRLLLTTAEWKPPKVKLDPSRNHSVLYCILYVYYSISDDVMERNRPLIGHRKPI